METLPVATEPYSERISGLIERVTFFNEDSGFCVLRVKAPGHRDLVTVNRFLAVRLCRRMADR